MFRSLYQAMEAHAREALPEPASGAVFGTDGAFAWHPVTEVADRSREAFRIDAAALRRLERTHGPLLAVVHTHPSAEGQEIDPLLFTPSASEMRAQASLAVPFGIVVCSRQRCFEPFWFGDQCPMPPLLDRPFRHGVTDCYSLIRDWYRQERQVLLPEFPRDWDWWREDGQDLYRTGFGQAGFHPIDREEAGEGDVVLFRMRSPVPNHGGVVLNREWMLHHPASVRPYDTMRISHHGSLLRWARHATHWIRHDTAASSPDADSAATAGSPR